MDRNEVFPQQDVMGLCIHLSWTSLEILSSDTDSFQLFISGSDADVEGLKVTCEEGMLKVEQSAMSMSPRINSERWMQLIIRTPRQWKGSLEAHTVSAPISIRGLTGTDLDIESVTGQIRLHDMEALELTIKQTTGDVHADRLYGQQLSLRTISGAAVINVAAFRQYHLNTVSGDAVLEMIAPFEAIDGHSISGDVRIYAPIAEADVNMKTVSGRIRTAGVSLLDGAAPVNLTSVSGSLELHCSQAEA